MATKQKYLLSLLVLAAASGGIFVVSRQETPQSIFEGIGDSSLSGSTVLGQTSAAISPSANLSTVPLLNLDWEKVETKSGVKYKNGDFVIHKNNTLQFALDSVNSSNIARHSIRSEDIDRGAVTSRTIENHSIQGRDIDTATSVTIGSLIVSGNIDFNDTGTNDIAGTLNLSGNALTSSGALTITPASGNNLNIALSTTGDFAVNTSQFYVDTSTGNVGIGTTTPSYPLHVIGQCVTADTRLRRRRKARKGEEDEADEDGYIYDEVMIKDIRSGDEIASMDQITGRLVWSCVNGLLDMGKHIIYEMTTQTRRQIRTTDNHPYFVRTVYETSDPARERQKLHRFEVDQSVRFEEYPRDTVIAVANSETSATVMIPRAIKQALRDSWDKRKSRRRLAPTVFAEAVVLVVRNSSLAVHELVIDIEYLGYEREIISVIKSFLPDVEISFGQVGRKSSAHIAAYGVFKKIKTADYVAALGERETADKKTENAPPTVLYADKPHASEPYRALLHIRSIAMKKDIVKKKKIAQEGVWRRVAEIHEGQQIAVVHGGNVVWERVMSIKVLPVERVYDIEIDGTHNFIGNDIVAHNTYIGGDLTMAAHILPGADDTYDLGSATARFRDLYLGPATLHIGTSTAAEGLITYTDTTQDVLNIGTDATANADIAFFTDDLYLDKSAGNVGIGTTSPTAVLHLKAGTATASTAPLKFTSGTLLATAEAGAVEFLTDAYYGTITTGAARKTFAFLESPTFTGTVTLPTPFTLGATSVTTTGTQFNYLNAATGTTGTTSTNLVFSTSPSLTTPTLGVASATTINKVTITAPASGSTLTIADGKTLSASDSTTFATNSITFGGGEVLTLSATNSLSLLTTGSTSVTLPTSGTLYGTATDSITSLQLLTSLSDETGTGAAVFGTSPTFTTGITAPLIIGGSATTSTLTLRSTSGVGTTNADIIFQTGNNGATEAMRILNSGNVGIGTTGPGAKLDISDNSGGAPSFRISNSTAGAWMRLIGASTGNFLDSDDDLIFRTGASYTEGMRVTTSGNVGIGTTGPGAKLGVKRSANSDGFQVVNTDDTVGVIGIDNSESTSLTVVSLDSAWDPMVIQNNNAATIVTFKNSGNVGIGTTGPGSKLDVTTAGLAATQTTSSGLALVNTTAATALAPVQISPAIRWSGFGWKTDVTAASQAVDFRAFVTPVQGTANPTGYLGFGSSVNGAAYSDNQLVITTAGNVGIGTTTPAYKLGVAGGDVFIGSSVSDTLPVLTVGGVNRGDIKVGSTAAYQGLLSYRAAGTTNLYLDNSYDNAAAAMNFRMRTAGTAVNAMTILGSGNVGIGTTSPGSKLDVTTAGLAATQTTSSGLALVNTTAATALAPVQISPAIRWSGLGWKTDVTAASQAVDFRAFVTPVQGTANPTGYLGFGSSVNGAAYSDNQLVITTTGNVGIGTTMPADKFNVSGRIVMDNANNAFSTSKFDSQGVAWSSSTAIISMIFNGGASERPEISWIRGSRTYPEFSIRQNTTGDTGGSIFSGAGIAAPIETMTFNNGKVGIGTTGPNEKLDILGGNIRFSTANSYLKFVEDGYIMLDATASGNKQLNIVNQDNTTAHFFREDGTTYHSGNVGIGTTGPQEKLDVRGAGLFGDQTTSVASSAYLQVARSNDPIMAFRHLNAAAVGQYDYTDYYFKNTGGTETIAARIAAVHSTTHATQPGGELQFAVAPAGGTLTTQVVIKESGNVGIGTAAPTQKLHLNNGVFRISGGGSQSNGEINLDSGTEYDGWQVRKETATLWGVKSVTSGNDMALYVDNTNTKGLYIKSGGNVGIGTTNPQGLLDVNSKLIVASNGDITQATTGGFAMWAANSVAWPTYGFTGDGGVGMYRPATDELRFATAGNDRVTITSDGNVGIGTASPGALLHLVSNGGSDASAQIRLDTLQAGNDLAIMNDAGRLFISDVGASAIRMAINTSGYVGIGTTSPGAKLNVVADSVSDYAAELFNDGNATTRWGLLVQAGLDDQTTAGPSTLVQFNDGDGTAVGSITFGSSVTNYNTSSDVRLKQNIVDSELGVSDLMHIQVRDYTWRADESNRIAHGFIAQELYNVYPDAVTVPKDDRYWMVDYSKLTPLIVKSIQDQQGEITEQKGALDTISLQTTQNITTVSELQASVDKELLVISGSINTLSDGLMTQKESLKALKEAYKEQSDRITALEAQGSDTGWQSSFDSLSSRATLLDSKIETLSDQMASLADFYATFELGNILSKDSLGNVDIGAGVLSAKAIRSDEGLFKKITIEKKSAAAALVGKDAIKAGEKKITIKTTSVEKGSNILVTPREAFDGSLAVTDVVDGESFTVETAKPAEKDIPFTWLIVGEQEAE